MKKITFFLIAMLFSISASAQFTFEWTAQPISEGNNLKGMDVVNDTMAIVVGYGRTFVTSNDQGANWDNVEILTPEYNFGDISINSSGLGYATAGDVKVIDNPGSGEPDVYADGLLLKTTDYGATWTVVDISELGPEEGDPTDYPNQIGSYAMHFYSVEVLENNSVYIGMAWYYYESAADPRIEYKGVLMSSDGVSWTAVTDNGSYPLGIEASVANVYFGGLNHLFRADASTGVVTDIYTNLTDAAGDLTVFIWDFNIVDEDLVFVVTSTNGVYVTRDQGATFEKLAGTGIPSGTNDMLAVNDTVWMLLGGTTKSVITHDSGLNWVDCNAGSTIWEVGGILNDTIYALAKTNVYKLSVADAIAGNYNWVSQEITFNENLHKMHITDANHAIIAGYGQTLVSTSDGGATWTDIALPELFVYGADYDFEDVSTIDTVSYAISKRFYMVDYPSGSAKSDVFAHGLIYKSTDLWKTWELLDYTEVGAGVDPTVDPNADGAFGLDPMCLTAVNDTVVYIGARWLDSIADYDTRVGHSNVFRTEDGGDTWLPLFEDQGNRVFNNIQFIDENLGFFLGNSFLRKTEDGGKTFVNMYHALVETASPTDTVIFLKEIHYIDENNWYLLSSVDGVFVTADGGVNYTKVTGIGGGGGMTLLDESSILVLGSSTKSKLSWDAGATWNVCYPGSTVWGIGGVLNDELVALAKTSLYKIPLADLEPPSEAADILSFVLTEQTGAAVIDAVNHTITIEVAEGTDYTALSPTITLSEGATVAPASGAAQDFTNPVGYTVTAEDQQTSIAWTVTVTVYAAPSREANILTFVLAEQTGDAVIDAVNSTVSIEVAEGTNVSALTPTITISDLASITPASGVAQDFSNPVSYTVTAEDTEVSLVWTVTVTVAVPLSSDADILTFLLPEQTANAVIDAVNHTVNVDVEEGTDPSALTPMITISAGATIDPASLATLDFTNPVSYTVTAEDGTEIVWTVTVDAGVGTEQLTMDNIRIYPNPVKGKLHLENLEMVDRVAIISITGSSMLSIGTPSTQAEIDVTAFEGGIYFIKFTDIEGGVATKKLIIE